MEIAVQELPGNLTLVRLQGRLDSEGADRSGTRFSAAVVAPGRDAVVDLTGVNFLASMGIRLLIMSARALHQKGAKMVLFGASGMVGSVLEHVALDQIIPIVATQEEAVERVTAQ